MSLNAAQIRAARGLLDWTRDQLANASGVSVPALSKIETSRSNPHPETIAKVQSALEMAGCVFTDNSGVKLKSDIVQIFEGKDGYRAFFDEVYYLMARNGGEILAAGGYEKDFHETSGPDFLKFHATRMSQLHDFKIRAIKADNQNYTNSLEYVDFRYLPEDQYFFVPYYLYAGRMAMFIWEPDVKVLVINDSRVYEAYRQQFELLWRIARRSGV